MIQLFFAAETAESASHASEGLPLGLSLQAFIIQLVTFILVFLLLKKFAFKPIVKMLNERHKVIDDGVRLGQKMEKEQAQLEEHKAEIVRQARHEADAIVATAHKEARDVNREAEKSAHKKAEAILADAEVRIKEETDQAKRKLEKDVAKLVAEATEAVVEQKLDKAADSKLIDKIVKEKLHK